MEKRCPRVEIRSIIGQWEGDTGIGNNQQEVVVTLVERRSDFAVMRKVASKGADEVATAIIAMLMPYWAMVWILTSENGSGLARLAENLRAINRRIYLARSYASWQRGSNENLDHLLRQYLPKRLSFTRITPRRVFSDQSQLNDRARKRLDWATPLEVLEATAKHLGIALAE